MHAVSYTFRHPLYSVTRDTPQGALTGRRRERDALIAPWALDFGGDPARWWVGRGAPLRGLARARAGSRGLVLPPLAELQAKRQ